MSENISSTATCCIACRRPIVGTTFYRADGFGPYCPDCADIKDLGPQMTITLPPATDSPITTVKLGEPIYKYPKPLRWRTGPVPVDANGIGMEVYFELRDGCGHGLGTGEKKGGVWEGDWHLRKESILRWLPLSEILALVEE